MSAHQLDRRTVLQTAGASAALVAAAGLTWPSRVASAPRAPSAADWNGLQRDIDGSVIQRGDNGFAKAHQLFNPRFDALRPLAVVECTSAADVQTTISFARQQGLRCRPKAGGHSYVGASTMKGGVVIDVSRIAQRSYDSGSKIATIGAGAGLYDVHRALASDGRTIPTGTCPTVAAAGLTLGGGLGVASRQFGLTCDQLEGLTIVTADGRKLTVNDDQHSQLFWASRGGGGGNFGIVTSLRFQTQPTHRMGFFLVSFPWGSAAAVIRGWSRRAHQMKRSAWANLHLEANSDGSAAVRVVGACRAGDEDSEAAALEAAVGVSPTSVSTFQKSYLAGVEFLGGGTTSARETFAAGSDILPRMTVDLSKTLARIVKKRARSGRSAAVILDPLTGAVSDPGPRATAFPWRHHLCDIQWYVGLPTGASQSTVQDAYGWINRAHTAVRSSSAGGYINYLEPGRPIGNYYGANLPRLRRIKAQVDPHDFFHTPYTI